MTQLEVKVRAQVCLKGAGKCSMASDGWSNPRLPGAVGVKSKLIAIVVFFFFGPGIGGVRELKRQLGICALLTALHLY